MDTLAKARAAYRRAVTIHDREQSRGRRDVSVMQTRRMALAVAALQRAARRLQDASACLWCATGRGTVTAAGKCPACGRQVTSPVTDDYDGVRHPSRDRGDA